MEPWGDYPDLAEIPENAVPGPELTLFVKERGHGPGYVADFLYKAADLPATEKPLSLTGTAPLDSHATH
jgi:hypothetical protein